MDIKHIYEDPSILHEGTMPPRAAFMSCDPVTGEELRRSLNGTWQFACYGSIREGRTALRDGSFRDHAAALEVPSVWQHTGYDRPQYINTRYPIPTDPPYVPADNPMGIYERDIEATAAELEQKVILRFDGVDSCFFLFVNENYVGYSQVSHAISEFDITAGLHAGSNRLTVCVLKWCDGTYLECQDKFRETGIFRDVDLLLRNRDHIMDYTVTACPDESLTRGEFKLQLDRAYGYDITCSLSYEGAEVASAKVDGDSVTIEVDNPELWNAEQPRLYELTLTTPYEKIVDHVGFRRIDLRDGVFYLNNVPFKMRGVNYHDSDPYVGARLTRERAISDLKLMKLANINAIRTSHYPKPYWFMDLCDSYGFYIVDEADIETHGASYIYVDGEPEVSAISRDPMFTKAYVDRIGMLYERDKNRPSVLLWSLGNESGYGENLVEGMKLLHSKGDGRPVHYEGADREYSFDIPEKPDVYSNMYASCEYVEDYCNNSPLRLTRPYMQCEFCHAMGNGPGDLYENVEQLYRYEHYFGAFVWEWCDHAVYDGRNEDGSERFLYGGDSGERYHDGDFCMDGLVYPDRRPHTGYLEYRNILRPVRLVSFNRETGAAVFENKMDFAGCEGRIRIDYEVKQNGYRIAGGSIGSPVIAAHGRVKIDTRIGRISDEQYVIFRYYTAYATELVSVGTEMGFDEVTPAAYRVELPEISEDGQLHVAESDYEVTIAGDEFAYRFDKELGSFTSIIVKDKPLITRPVQFNILRGYMDNDKDICHTWERNGYNDAALKVYETKVTTSDGEVSITLSGALGAPYRSPALRMNVTWTVNAAGVIGLSVHGVRNTNFEFLPRFGVRMFLPADFEDVEYFGYGPHESYIDKHRSTILDRYMQRESELHEAYNKPQENGSRYGVEYLDVTDGMRRIFVTGDKPVSFNLSRYTAEEMNSKAHRWELRKDPDMVLCVDYKMSGCGSNSCGPKLSDKYALAEAEFDWTVKIIPGVAEDAED